MHSHTDDIDNFRFAFWINTFFSVIEVIGGFLFGSLAILSDAIHDASDSISLGLGWYFQKLSKKSGDRKFSYGYRRFNILGAVINGVILILGSLFIIYHSVDKFLNPVTEPDSLGMMGMAVIGIGFNFWAFWRMHSGKSLNEQVLSLHLLEDVLGWVAVLIGGAVIWFTGWVWVDPLLSLLISFFIGFKAVKRLINCFKLLMQGVPDDINVNSVKADIEKIDPVKDVTDLHIWSMDGDLYVMTIHLSVTRNMELDEQLEVKKKVRSCVDHDAVNHITIEFEAEGEEKTAAQLSH